MSGRRIPAPLYRHLPRPSLQKLVQPHLIACFLPANTESILTEEPAQGALGTPSPRRAAGRLTSVPASQQAKQVAAGLLQQDVVVAFVRAVGVVVVSEVAQSVHCKGVCSSLGLRVGEMPPPPAIWDSEVRSQAQPDWTKHFLPSPGPAPSPASGVPHPSGCCLFKDSLEAPAMSPGSPVLHSGSVHCHQQPITTASHGSPGKAPSGEPLAERTTWAGALLPRTTKGTLLFTRHVSNI